MKSKLTCTCGKHLQELEMDISSVLAMLQGNTEREKIINFIEKYLK